MKVVNYGIFIKEILYNYFIGGFEAVKAQYPHLIECSIDIIPREKHEQEQVPPTPEVAVDKENFTMTEIQSRLFVGKY